MLAPTHEPTAILVCDYAENHPSCVGYRGHNHPEGHCPGRPYWRVTAQLSADEREKAERWAGRAGLIVELPEEQATLYRKAGRLPDPRERGLAHGRGQVTQ